MAWDTAGHFYFTDVPRSQLFKVNQDSGEKTLIDGATGRANGIAFGPDGRLYGCSSGEKAIYAWDPKTWQKTAVNTGTLSNDIAILELDGRLTIGDGDVVLRQDVEDLLAEKRNKILINFRGVRSMDSSGVGELMRARTRAEEAGGTIKLLHIEDKVADVLQVTQLIGVFEIFEDEEAALLSFR